MKCIKVLCLSVLLSVMMSMELMAITPTPTSNSNLVGTLTYNELQKLTSEDEMGMLAVNDHMAVIGLPNADNNAVVAAGAVLVYVHNKTTNLYEYATRIDALSPLENDHFGGFVAINKNSIIIRNSGQYYYDWATSTTTVTPKSVFVYEFHSAIDVRLVSTFNSPTGANDSYGNNIYIDGDRFVVTSDTTAYIYQRNASTGTYELTKNQLDIGYVTSNFKIQGEYIFYGDPQDSSTVHSNAGAVYVYKVNETSGSFEKVDTLIPSGVMIGDGFGSAISVSGNTIAIASTGNDYYGMYPTLRSSSLHIFDYNSQTGHFEESYKLLYAPNITSYGDIYRDFTLEDNTLIVNLNDTISVYTRANASGQFTLLQSISFPQYSSPRYTLSKNVLRVEESSELKIYERETLSDIFNLNNTISNSEGDSFSYVGSTEYKMFIKVTDGISVSGTSGYTMQESFIERFYQNILGRTADTGGMATWLDAIQTQSAAAVAEGFFSSSEFTALGLNDEDFVDILYQTLFDRGADAGGRADWLGQLSGGIPRNEVIQGFLNAPEFKNLADSFGVSATSVGGFVNRFYELVLDRASDEAGFNDWTSQLNSKTKGGGDIARGFFNSQEYTQRGLSNPVFLDICYRAFFDREADAGGKSTWLTNLTNGATKNEVLDGFINSQEFSNLAAVYGIVP